MKAVLLSIRPEWCDLIIRGQKTIEVRRTKPGNLKTPFKCYVYCTKSKSKTGWLIIAPGEGWKRLDGNIIGEFTCDKIERALIPYPARRDEFNERFAKDSCVSYDELHRYASQNALYVDLFFWHISNFKLYEEPVRLKDFWAIQPCTHRGDCCTCRRWDAEKLICREKYSESNVHHKVGAMWRTADEADPIRRPPHQEKFRTHSPHTLWCPIRGPPARFMRITRRTASGKSKGRAAPFLSA